MTAKRRRPDGKVVVRTFYPADPIGVVPGGVDTFIRGILKWAPADLIFELVGMTTAPQVRPAGRWTRCDLGRREFDFFPVVTVADAAQRTRLPLSVRYTAGLAANWRAMRQGFDIFEFHRVEPALLFLRDRRPKNAFFHQDMAVIQTQAKADILWKHFPGLYFALESRVVRGLDSAWCVREAGTQALRVRNPTKADVLRFVPTWVDTEVFAPADPPARAAARQALALATGLDASAAWVVSVGRLDTQKDPDLLLQSLLKLAAQGQRICWLVVGDGPLRTTLENTAQQAGFAANIAFLGLRPPGEIARILSACDVFALSSAYEGMPMALLEALACGLPVTCTDVGEVRRVVTPGVNGEVSAASAVEAFSSSLGLTIARRNHYHGDPATNAIERYLPQIVLEPVYENYRILSRRR